MRIVLASGNLGKVAEFQALFAKTPIEIMAQSVFQLDPVEETGATFLENALLKARYVHHHTKLPTIADDSGLDVDALDGAPGIYSARFAGVNATPAEHIKKLLNELREVPADKRTARFHCVLVYLQNDAEPIICKGVWEGKILFAPKGAGGFGYDPIFFVPTDNCSAAELSFERKIQLSHRGQAMRALLNQLK
ncbi:MAG: non-canonical purine NTP pyrophosphatase, RdgB/HAM1 family [Gammaproteobacteria bacterium RIFCSPHIGHO2_02_FULL_42_13]|nr:MAG: non-canonical purine NTP pyrophosphatase, RdgB/HAM1 family [Gammaproteobacteria bacterium RIFCSPHIGHO2_02_FULL_42_13]